MAARTAIAPLRARQRDRGAVVEPLARIKTILHLRDADQRARSQELRDALRTLDTIAVHALLADGLAEHDHAIQRTELPEPWLHGPGDPGLELVLWIAQVRPDACAGLSAELWRRHVFGHGVLYQTADAATRDELLAEVDAALEFLLVAFADLAARPRQWGTPGLEPTVRERLAALTRTPEWRMLDVALRMLAWIGDSTVQQWFPPDARCYRLGNPSSTSLWTPM